MQNINVKNENYSSVLNTLEQSVKVVLNSFLS
jgi:hypothetical protein